MSAEDCKAFEDELDTEAIISEVKGGASDEFHVKFTSKFFPMDRAIKLGHEYEIKFPGIEHNFKVSRKRREFYFFAVSIHKRFSLLT